MNAIELNMRLLKGAIDMRNDEHRWHAECFPDVLEPFPHQWHNVEKVVTYWIRYKMLPDRSETVIGLPKIGKDKKNKKVRFVL